MQLCTRGGEERRKEKRENLLEYLAAGEGEEEAGSDADKKAHSGRDVQNPPTSSLNLGYRPSQKVSILGE